MFELVRIVQEAKAIFISWFPYIYVAFLFDKKKYTSGYIFSKLFEVSLNVIYIFYVLWGAWRTRQFDRSVFIAQTRINMIDSMFKVILPINFSKLLNISNHIWCFIIYISQDHS